MNAVLNAASAILSATPTRWASLAQTVLADLLVLTLVPGEWSALGCLQHLVDMEPVFQFRVDAFLAGRDFPDFDPDTQGNPARPQAPTGRSRGRIRPPARRQPGRLGPPCVR